MIATISPSASNSEHTLNTLRYADRVKELKGGSNQEYSDEEFEEFPTFMDENMEVEEIAASDTEANMLDEEYPPDTLAESPPHQTVTQTKAAILQQVNKKQLSLSRSLNENEYQNAINSPPLSSHLSERHSILSEITKYHHNHIKDCTESNKAESKMLVKVTSKMEKYADNDEIFDESVDSYLKELDEILRLKIESAHEIRKKIREQYAK